MTTSVEPSFVVVGSGRHGSGYISEVLTAAGVRCGHEDWWNPLDDRIDGLTGDSSWCAVPFLDTFDGLVLHQVRHPLAVVASLMKAPLWDPYRGLLSGIVADGLDPLEHAMQVCVELNERSERHAARRWRVEDVDAALVREIGELVGVPVSGAVAEAAVSSVSTRFNWHGLGVPLGWEDLPDAGRLRDLAGRYGYLIEEVPREPDTTDDDGLHDHPARTRQ